MRLPIFGLVAASVLLGIMGFFKKRRRSSSTPDDEQEASHTQEEVVETTAGSKYEVFLSFCGKDTRCSFVDFLYVSLTKVGVVTFRDEEGLRKGETIRPELLNAIRQSSISIVVFSEGYARSKWCLWELEEMVKCKKANGQKIYPIFYDVEPTDVRNQTGSSTKAFRKHNKDFGIDTVKAWKEALREVGAIDGWERLLMGIKEKL